VLSQISLFLHRFSEIAETDHHTIPSKAGTLPTLSGVKLSSGISQSTKVTRLTTFDTNQGYSRGATTDFHQNCASNSVSKLCTQIRKLLARIA
jgi:hypothetical protein